MSMMVERHMRPRFKATRKVYPAVDWREYDGPEVITQTRWFASAAAAWRFVAYGFLFRMAANHGAPSDREKCRECSDAADCRWHNRAAMTAKADRIARLLKHWEGKESRP